MQNHNSDHNRSAFPKFPLGPLYSCRVSLPVKYNALAKDKTAQVEPQTFEWLCFGFDDIEANVRGLQCQRFLERLQELIKQALHDGCSARELSIVIRQHTSGDHHVDA